jgi:hypothetical protein
MIAIVTATTNLERAQPCIDSWRKTSHQRVPVLIVQNGPPIREYLGTVPAFREGVADILQNYTEIDIIACLHDDVEITEHDWDEQVLRAFDHHPEVGLLGFGGAIGLGADGLYREPYDPMQLARVGFRSNMIDAEAHGIRSLLPEPVACLDGFSQIGRRAFWAGLTHGEWRAGSPGNGHLVGPWDYLAQRGIVHHFYDGALGCLARRAGWVTYYLPVACRHLGGQTAVGDPGYQDWAATQTEGGDRGFWETAHRTCYTLFEDVLPLRA